jgi:CheY-like chemotaxis protein
MPKSILLADDSLTIQKVVELTFSDGDYELIAVSNGVEAIEALARKRPDLVIADVVMPGKNGYEVCEHVKGNPDTASIPVILLSGTFEPFDRDRAEQVRANAIVTKPFDSKNLLAQVDALIGSGGGPAVAPATLRPPMSTETGEFFPEEMGAGPLEAEADFGAPEPVTADIEESIRAYEAVSTATEIEPAGEEPQAFTEPVEEPEETPADLAEAESPARTAEFRPPLPRPQEHRVEPLEFDMDDSSPFGKPAPPAEPVPASPEGDNVFDFPASSVEPDLRESESAVFTEEAPADLFAQEESPEVAASREALLSEVEAVRQEPTGAPFVADDEYPTPPIEQPAEFVAAPIPEEPEPLAQAPPPMPAPEPEPEPEPEPSVVTAPPEPVAPDLERLAQSASVADLARMVHQVAPGSLSEEDLDRLARRVVEQISDRVIREIAWEVIPDVAEIVIRKRIEQLESEAAEPE